MKKISICLLFLLVIVLSACGSVGSDTIIEIPKDSDANDIDIRVISESVEDHDLIIVFELNENIDRLDELVEIIDAAVAQIYFEYLSVFGQNHYRIYVSVEKVEANSNPYYGSAVFHVNASYNHPGLSLAKNELRIGN